MRWRVNDGQMMMMVVEEVEEEEEKVGLEIETRKRIQSLA